MSLIQLREEEEYSLASRHDRFDGFDRGDAGRDDAADWREYCEEKWAEEERQQTLKGNRA